MTRINCERFSDDYILIDPPVENNINILHLAQPLPVHEVEQGMQFIEENIRRKADSTFTHHPLTRVIKAVLGSLKMALGIATMVLTGGTVFGAVSGSLMVLSAVNDFVYACTGNTIGEHIKAHWPDNNRAAWAGFIIDNIFKLAAVVGSGLGAGLENCINVIFNIQMHKISGIVCGVLLTAADELANVFDKYIMTKTNTPAQGLTLQEIENMIAENEEVLLDFELIDQQIGIRYSEGPGLRMQNYQHYRDFIM